MPVGITIPKWALDVLKDETNGNFTQYADLQLSQLIDDLKQSDVDLHQIQITKETTRKTITRNEALVKKATIDLAGEGHPPLDPDNINLSELYRLAFILKASQKINKK